MNNNLLIRWVLAAFKRYILIFFTYIILSWKHKYKQTFAIVFLVIVTNSEQRIRVFPVINTADSIYVPWFRLTLVDMLWN